jgi:beta-lactamase regulating signal transducer with metallopeptidase domain
MSNWVATCVLNGAWQITAITLLTLIGERLLRRGPSRYVHVAWVVALAACLFVPAMTILMQARDAQRVTADAGVQSGEVTDASRSIKGGVPFSFYSRSRSVLFPPTLIRLLVWTYAALVLFRGAQLAWTGYRTSRIRKQAFACAIPLSLSGAAERCRQVFSTRPVPILCTTISAGPATIGTMRPILVLPETFFNGSLEEPDLICALSHEFAHIRRHDFLVNLACELLYVLVCFHPCAALIMARIAQTRELACDEMAARMSPSAGHYARSLLQIARTILSGRRQKLNYGLGLFDTNTLEERVMNILSTTKTNWQWTRAKQWTAACLVAAVCLGLSAFSLRVDAGSSPAELERFVGTWQAKYNGTVFFTFNIHSANGSLGGTCTHTDRLAYVDGELIPTGEKMSTEKITEAKVSGHRLLVKVAVDSSDSVPFEFKLTANGQAEVRVLMESASGTPAPKKPWHFERVSTSQ